MTGSFISLRAKLTQPVGRFIGITYCSDIGNHRAVHSYNTVHTENGHCHTRLKRNRNNQSIN